MFMMLRFLFIGEGFSENPFEKGGFQTFLYLKEKLQKKQASLQFERFSGLAAARSRSGSDSPPGCHSRPSRRFATSTVRRWHNEHYGRHFPGWLPHSVPRRKRLKRDCLPRPGSLNGVTARNPFAIANWHRGRAAGDVARRCAGLSTTIPRRRGAGGYPYRVKLCRR